MTEKHYFQISHEDKKPFHHKNKTLRLFLSWYIPWSCKPAVPNKVNVFIQEESRDDITVKDLQNLHKSFAEEEKPDNMDAVSLNDILAVSVKISNGCKETLKLQIIGTDPFLPAETKKIVKSEDGRIIVNISSKEDDDVENEIYG